MKHAFGMQNVSVALELVLVVSAWLSLSGCGRIRREAVGDDLISAITSGKPESEVSGENSTVVFITREICMACPSGQIVERLMLESNKHGFAIHGYLVGDYDAVDLGNFTKVTGLGIDLAVADSIIVHWFDHTELPPPGLAVLIRKNGDFELVRDPIEAIRYVHRGRN